MKKLLISILLFLPSLSLAAGSCVVTPGEYPATGGPVQFVLTSDASGDVSADTCVTAWRFDAYGRRGRILSCSAIPSTTAAPTPLYDITIIKTETYGDIDISGAGMSDLPATGSDGAAYLLQIGSAFGQPDIRGKLAVIGDNMGNAKSTTIICEVEIEP